MCTSPGWLRQTSPALIVRSLSRSAEVPCTSSSRAGEEIAALVFALVELQREPVAAVDVQDLAGVVIGQRVPDLIPPRLDHATRQRRIIGRGHPKIGQTRGNLGDRPDDVVLEPQRQSCVARRYVVRVTRSRNKAGDVRL